jgi:peptide deformylase
MSLILYPNPKLKEKSSLILNSIPDDKDLQKLIKKMFSIMDAFNGVGLSAIQVGLPLSLFVLKVGGERQVVINPQYIPVENAEPVDGVLTSAYSYEQEGCLSAPAVFTRIRRPEKIDAKFFDEKGELQVRTYTGLWSRAFQHEYDHLCGITFFDRMTTIQRAAALKKYKKITSMIPKEYFEQTAEEVSKQEVL